MRLTDREADFAPDWESNWANYPHSDGKVRMWHQTQRIALAAGERTAYVNLLYPANRRHPQSFAVERAGETAVRILDRRRGKDRQGTVLAGVADPVYGRGSLEVEGKLFRVDADGFTVVEGTSLSLGGTLFRAWSPVSVEMDLATGRGTIDARQETRIGLRAEAVTVDGKRVTGRTEGGVFWFGIPAGRHRLAMSPKRAGTFAKLLAERGPAAPARNLVPQREQADRSGFETIWSVPCGAPITAVASAAGGHLVGTASGETALVLPDGGTAWSFEARGAVRAVHLADVDGCGREEAMVGTRDCHLHVLDRDGRARWEHRFPPGSGMRAQRLMTISSCDLGGDGRKQVLAGTEGWLFHAFEADGTLRWQTETHYHCVTGCLPVDLDGDGRQEVMVGTEYYTINCLNPDGTGRWRKSTGCVSPTILSADLDGDGRPEVIYGDWRGIQAVRGEKGETVWTHNLGGEVEDIALADVDGDGAMEVVAASDIGQLACFRADGTAVFRRDLIEKITWLAPLDADGDGRAEIAVGFASGEVRLYDGTGALLAGRALDGEVTHLRAVTADGARAVLCGTSAGTLSLLRPL
jgi:outer membrane protein assembly factor BamB